MESSLPYQLFISLLKKWATRVWRADAALYPSGDDGKFSLHIYGKTGGGPIVDIAGENFHH